MTTDFLLFVLFILEGWGWGVTNDQRYTTKDRRRCLHSNKTIPELKQGITVTWGLKSICFGLQECSLMPPRMNNAAHIVAKMEKIDVGEQVSAVAPLITVFAFSRMLRSLTHKLSIWYVGILSELETGWAEVQSSFHDFLMNKRSVVKSVAVVVSAFFN